MQKSRYILTSKYDDNKYIVTNLITGVVVSIDSNEYSKLISILEKPKLSKHIDDDLYSQACELGFLVPEGFDELTLAKKMHWNDRVYNKVLNLTLLPTLDCNFECEYCYEKGLVKKDMDKKILESICKLVKNKINSVEKVNICWYGGEPLLVIDKIIHLNQKLSRLCQENNVEFYSSVSTNGYLLSKTTVDKLIEIGIKHIETTLAGTSLYHDKLRLLNDKTPTYNTIVKNIKNASKYLKTMVNVNITKTSYSDISNLLHYFKDNQIVDNIYFTFNRVVSTTNNSCEHLVMDEEIYNKKAINLYNEALDLGLNICDVTRFTASCIFCAAQNINSITIGPEGNIFKCSEKFDDANSIGTLSNNGEIRLKKSHFHNTIDPFNDSMCKDCEILPYCNGGCSNNSCGNKCPSEKDYMEQYLKLFYRRNEEKEIL